MLTGKRLTSGKIRLLLLTGLVFLAGVNLLPRLVDAALLNRAAVVCGRELLATHQANYFLTGLKAGQNNSSICREALADFQKVTASDSQLSAVQWSGRVQLARHNFAQAATEFEKATRLDPTNHLGRFFGGISYLANGQTDQAKQAWQLMSAPTYALITVGDQLAGQECNAALVYYRLALEAGAPGQERAHLGTAQCLYSLKRLPEAADAYKAALNAGLKSAEVANKLGKLLLTLERSQEALLYLEQAVSWHRYLYYLLDLAEAYGTIGDAQKVEVWFGEAEQLAPASPAVPYARGNYYFKQQQFAKAIASYERVITLDPQGPVYYYTNLARAYLAARLPAKALPLLQEAQRREPANPTIKQLIETASITTDEPK